MKKKTAKTHRKHQGAHSHRRRPSHTATTSSNWDETVRSIETPLAERQASSPSTPLQGEYTPGELGQPGSLDQEGEGNRQNDQLDELEHIDAASDLKRRL